MAGWRARSSAALWEVHLERPWGQRCLALRDMVPRSPDNTARTACIAALLASVSIGGAPIIADPEVQCWSRHQGHLPIDLQITVRHLPNGLPLLMHHSMHFLHLLKPRAS
jgi:hypothetical protein